MESIVKTRKQAYADGDLLYYTGRACKQGHLSQRYVSNGCCKYCINQTFKRRYVEPDGPLVNFIPSKLRAPRSYGINDLIRLRHYLQTCVFAYMRQASPELIDADMEFRIAHHTKIKPRVDDINEIP